MEREGRLTNRTCENSRQSGVQQVADIHWLSQDEVSPLRELKWSGGGDQLRLAEDLPGAESPHTRHPLYFGISISPHPMRYVLNRLEIPELALRDSVAKFRTIPKKIFPCRGKSLTRKDHFWLLDESYYLSFWEGLCPSEKLSAIVPKILSVSRTLCLWVSLFVQSGLLFQECQQHPAGHQI